MNFPSSRCMLIAFFLLAGFGAHAQQVSRSNAYIQFMEKSAAHARKFGSPVPTLSPVDQSILPTTNTQGPLVPVEELHRLGIRVVPWTTNDPERMRALIRSGVDGIISDRPDILQQILREAREKGTQEEREHLEHFVSATRTPSCSARFSVASCLHGHNETAAKSRLARVGQ